MHDRTYHSMRDGTHSNVQWLLHDPDYQSADHLDKQVLSKIRSALRQVSPYVGILKTAMSKRCEVSIPNANSDIK